MRPKAFVKKARKIKDLLMLPPVRELSFSLSQNMIFGIFFSVTFFVASLLWAASMGVENVSATQIDLPSRHAVLENHVRKLVSGFPIEDMTPLIADQNKNTAAFLVGIAKKESNWGKRVPRTESGEDCFNYWGYRGVGSRGIAMGHACFGSPEEAVGVVGGRIDTLIREYHFDTPEEMIVWKCGWSCNGHSTTSVKKWIADVGYYSRKVKN